MAVQAQIQGCGSQKTGDRLLSPHSLTWSVIYENKWGYKVFLLIFNILMAVDFFFFIPPNHTQFYNICSTLESALINNEECIGFFFLIKLQIKIESYLKYEDKLKIKALCSWQQKSSKGISVTWLCFQTQITVDLLGLWKHLWRFAGLAMSNETWRNARHSA